MTTTSVKIGVGTKIALGVVIGLFAGVGSSSAAATALSAALLSVSLTMLIRQALEIIGIFRIEHRRHQEATAWNLDHDRF